MLTYLRYALAIVCFAASVGCLVLWWRSMSQRDMLLGSILNQPNFLLLKSEFGSGTVLLHDLAEPGRPLRWSHSSAKLAPKVTNRNLHRQERRSFRITRHAVYFPLWCPALVFALAGVASLRLGRRFTLRSVMIFTTVVAGLLGLAVTL